MPNARLRGWQRITLNTNTTTVTTAVHWDWKRHALTVPLEAFVRTIAERALLDQLELLKLLLATIANVL